MYIYENISIEDEFEQHKIETFSVLPMKQKYSPQWFNENFDKQEPQIVEGDSTMQEL